MRIKKEDIVGVYNDEELLCIECVKQAGIEFDDPGKLLLSGEIEKADDLVFCDRCKKSIESA